MAMKRTSLADLAVNAGAPPTAAPASKKAERKQRATKLSSDEDNDSASRVQVAFRMNKDAYRDLKRMALDEDTTVNELMVRAINELRERKGLKKLSG
jgi:uncharacterized protein YkwD